LFQKKVINLFKSKDDTPTITADIKNSIKSLPNIENKKYGSIELAFCGWSLL